MQLLRTFFYAFLLLSVFSNAYAGTRQQFEQLEGDGRENFILDAVANGQISQAFKTFSPVISQAVLRDKKLHILKFWVTQDYLQIDDGVDLFWAPVRFASAKKIMVKENLLIPTAKMVNLIYHQADLKIWAKTMPADDRMTTSPVFLQHTDLLYLQLEKRGVTYPCDCLSAGHKKDYVLSNRLLERPRREVIYGWFERDGSVIQSLSLAHNDQWVDYSHGLRGVAVKAELDGQEVNLGDILRHPIFSALVSDEGPMDPRRLISNLPSF